MLQKTILKDKAAVDVFKVMLGAVNPIQGIVGRFSFKKAYPDLFFVLFFPLLRLFIILVVFWNS